ncbi:hypothetical protein MJ561_17595 [Klebsiella pneumoniae]|nr:hypothetical protein MJ561_17595 [Klebsiella pneumoniae]
MKNYQRRRRRRWLDERELRRCRIRSIDAVVDVTNYVLAAGCDRRSACPDHQ